MTTPFDLRATRLGKGTMLLEASAGTGKTYTIVGIVLRLLLEGVALELPQILVVTFTIAATEELKTRLRRALVDAIGACERGDHQDAFLAALGKAHGAAGADQLRQALARIDELSVATIHSFCRRVLDEAAFESRQPFATEFLEDEIPLVAEAARDAVRLEVQTRPLLAAAVAAHEGLEPDALLPLYREWRRHADTAIAPPAGDVDECLKAVAIAHRAIRELAVAGDLPLDVLRRFQWNKSTRTELKETDRLADELPPRLLDADDPCLAWLLELARDNLEKKLPRSGYTRPPLDHALFAHCATLRDAVGDAAHALRARLLTTMDRRLAAAKARDDALTFQDLLQQVAAALRDPQRGKQLRTAIRERWRAALIDEFQDTDPLQYEVFADCFGEQRLYLVGDPKQSIYGFRGADVHAYLAARQDATERHTLTENHRSHPHLVHATSLLFAGPAAFALDGIELPAVAAALPANACDLLGDDAPPLQFRWLPLGSARDHTAEFAEARIVVDVADEIVRLLDGDVRLRRGEHEPPRPLAAGDIAVLTRTNAQAVAVQDELRRRGVHSAIGKAGDVFQCPEMDEMQRLLVALSNPHYLPLLRAAWTTPLIGHDETTLLALERDAAALEQQLQQADAWRRTWVRHGFVVMFEELLCRLDVRARLLRRADGERKLTNYLQIAELLHRAEMDRQLAPESLLQWLAHERRHAQEIDYELRELRLESDADAVQILTVHGSKGLQYEIVFVPFAWKTRMSPRSDQPVLVRTEAGDHVLAFPPDAADRRPVFDRAELAENLRLLYVAVTRARRRCYVHHAAAQRAARSAIGWLVGGSGQDTAATTDDIGKRLDQLQEHRSSVRARLEAIAAASRGTIGVLDLAVDPPPGPPACLHDARRPQPATPRPLPTRTRAGFRVGSFTAMLAGARNVETLRAADQVDAPVAPTVAAAVAPIAATGMFAFARGTKAGVCLHEILEHCDFAAADARAREQLVRETLWRHGLADAAVHTEPIDPAAATLAMLDDLCRRDLDGNGLRLAAIAASQRSAEWQFFVAAGRIAPRALAAPFAAHAPHLRDYAERLQTLPVATMHGFLHGFVDLVAEHDGRWYVFDWKSNWLGDATADYAPDRLADDMQRHHYVLQYHLYLLALHRHLRARLRDYDYDRCIGGACYVYLRGIGAPGHGVFLDRPPRSLIEALDGWLVGKGER